MSCLNRRRFCSTVLVAGVGCGWASALRGVEPLKRSGKPTLRISLAAYSFRNALADLTKFDLFRFIDYCADHSLDGAELTGYYFPGDVDDAYLLRIKRHAFLRGMPLSGTAVGNNFALPRGEERQAQIADVKTWVDRAAKMSAPHIRVFAGAAKGVDEQEAFKLCVEALEECADYAGQQGIFLGLENHGGIVAEASGVLRILQAVKSPWLGVNLDTGNFHTDDPYDDLARCAPYAVNVQLKVEMRPRRGGAEPADLGRIVKVLRDVNYQGYVALEYEAEEDPFNAVPGWLDRLRAACSA